MMRARIAEVLPPGHVAAVAGVVGPADGGRRRAGEVQDLDGVLDVAQARVLAAAANQHRVPCAQLGRHAGDPGAAARPVHVGGPHDRQRQPRALELAANPFLGLLAPAVRPDRTSVRMVLVAHVAPDGVAVDDHARAQHRARARVGRRAQHVGRAAHRHALEQLGRAPVADHRGQVEHQPGAGHGPPHRGDVGHVPAHDLDVRAPGHGLARQHQRAHAEPGREQAIHEAAADEAGRAGHQRRSVRGGHRETIVAFPGGRS